MTDSMERFRCHSDQYDNPTYLQSRSGFPKNSPRPGEYRVYAACSFQSVFRSPLSFFLTLSKSDPTSSRSSLNQGAFFAPCLRFRFHPRPRSFNNLYTNNAHSHPYITTNTNLSSIQTAACTSLAWDCNWRALHQKFSIAATFDIPGPRS